MSLSTGTSDCVYQQDGVCRLERVVSAGNYSGGDGCMYYVKKTRQKKNQTGKNSG